MLSVDNVSFFSGSYFYGFLPEESRTVQLLECGADAIASTSTFFQLPIFIYLLPFHDLLNLTADVVVPTSKKKKNSNGEIFITLLL